MKSGAAKSVAINATMLVATLFVCAALGEFVLRWRHPDRPPTVTAEVRQVQAHLKLHPKLGYTWRENIPYSDHILLKVSDTELDPLSTDRWGFINPPEAISAEQTAPINVIGLGDSFMEHGAFLFYTLFKEAGRTYYSMAIHRQCPPQYNIILNDYALPEKPKWLIYGLFENDFEETNDFENWARSNSDWFTYHSGTWCGRPQTSGAAERLIHRWTPGYYVTYRRALEKLKIESPNTARASSADPAIVAAYVRSAQESARAAGVRFLLVLIPSKATAITGRSPESGLYDGLITNLANDNVETLDLRPPFQQSPDPASLFYSVDGHWNRNGIRLAATAILAYLQAHDGTP